MESHGHFEWNGSLDAWVRLKGVADKQILYLTTIGRTTGLPREIEIWFVVWCERLYLFAETGEAAGWVKNIRRNPKVTVRIEEWHTDATARVLDLISIANCGTRSLKSPITNMDGARGCRWKSPRFLMATHSNLQVELDVGQ